MTQATQPTDPRPAGFTTMEMLNAKRQSQAKDERYGYISPDPRPASPVGVEADPWPKPKFGDVVENGSASEENPTRRGFFVREFKRSGRMNAGLTWEITDGKGMFWEFKPKDIAEEGRLAVTVEREAVVSGQADLHAIAKAAAEGVHKNGGCVPQLAFAPILWALQDAFPAAALSAPSVTREAGERVVRKVACDHCHRMTVVPSTERQP